MTRSVPLRLRVNGVPLERSIPSNRILLDLLREDLNLTGTKRGCDLGTCGCCTVLLDGVPTLSCLTLAKLVEGTEVTTVEGLGEHGELTALQRAFVERGATQCGFCTPGFLMTATALLRDHPTVSRKEIQEALSGNLCRCTGYVKIIEAVEAASRSGASPSLP
ncbi:4-hydroxybenzoyl-CoA reductase, gamma subunit [mine drainage metagenome]|uniref:4-hydroxybenzoyl-CoA reductase, gamma subunit n=2 Tax=mine drainage metagenome TaxID=410659 RepID=T0XUU9_9ZZZZ